LVRIESGSFRPKSRSPPESFRPPSRFALGRFALIPGSFRPNFYTYSDIKGFILGLSEAEWDIV
jgi:hypothetical protein